MTVTLEHHRSVIEALSEVDRLLLQSSDLEPILDTVLPSIGSVLKCSSASVFLVDGDSQRHARAYDCYTNSAAKRPVRRIEVDVRSLLDACRQTMCWWATLQDIETAPFLEPLAESGATIFHLCSLHHDQKVMGLLCVGYRHGRDHETESIGAAEFAGRLSVVLANHDRSEQLYREANFDSLTELPNRRLFLDRFGRELTRVGETGERGALLYVDIDRFKQINDTEGHSAGDAVLRLIAGRIGHCLKGTDTFARLGGDEFAVFLPRLPDYEAARRIAGRIIEILARPVIIAGRLHQIGASIGIARIPEDGSSADALLKFGDMAMHRAKESGRGRATFYAAEMHERMTRRTILESAMRRAVQRQEFDLAFQPIAHCASGGVLGMEALLRWPGGPEAAKNAPAVFVPIAEESGLIVDLGAWVMARACRQFAAWTSQGYCLDYVSINVSARQLREPALLHGILETIDRCEMRPTQLQVEITESVMADGAATDRTLRELSARGVRLALDDFGTGYSSLHYLRNYPIGTLKIDRSFMTGLPDDAGACRLVESIVRMGAALDKHVVAEGIETRAQYDFLDSIGCGAVQGFLTGRPMTSTQAGLYLGRTASA